MYYTYVLWSLKDGHFYTGWATDMNQRFQQHLDGKVRSTVHRRPFRLVYYEACLSAQDAQARERFLKSGPGKRFLRNRLRHSLAQ